MVPLSFFSDMDGMPALARTLLTFEVGNVIMLLLTAACYGWYNRLMLDTAHFPYTRSP